MRRHKLVSAWLLVLGLCSSGCVADAQQRQSAQLLEQLVAARAQFAAQQDACDLVGDVQTRLYGEPGLSNVQPAWSSLRAAAAALQAICGQSTLLAQPGGGSPAAALARERWMRGIDRQNAVACEHLRAAAGALGRSAPC